MRREYAAKQGDQGVEKTRGVQRGWGMEKAPEEDGSGGKKGRASPFWAANICQYFCADPFRKRRDRGARVELVT